MREQEPSSRSSVQVIVPDMFVMSKSIGGYGMPFALTMFKPELDIWSPGEHNGTFRGNQLSMVAAKAGLEYMLDHKVEAEVKRKEGIIRKYMDENIARPGVEIRGIGCIWGVQVADGKLALTPDGEMVSAATTEEWREGLRYIKSLYDIGAIYDGNFTQDAEQLRTIMNQEDVPVLFVPFGTISDGIDSDSNNEVYRQYQCISPLEGPDGTRITPYFKYSGLETGSFSITDKCSNPAAVLRWVDTSSLRKVISPHSLVLMKEKTGFGNQTRFCRLKW